MNLAFELGSGSAVVDIPHRFPDERVAAGAFVAEDDVVSIGLTAAGACCNLGEITPLTTLATTSSPFTMTSIGAE